MFEVIPSSLMTVAVNVTLVLLKRLSTWIIEATWVDRWLSEAGDVSSRKPQVHEGDYLLAVDKVLDDYAENFNDREPQSSQTRSFAELSWISGLITLVLLDILVVFFRRVYMPKLSKCCVLFFDAIACT